MLRSAEEALRLAEDLEAFEAFLRQVAAAG